MHRIVIDPATRLFLTSRVIAPVNYPRHPLRVRLRLSTDADAGILLDFTEIEPLRRLALETRSLYNDARAALDDYFDLPARPVARSLF